jgi:hypothetical protein
MTTTQVTTFVDLYSDLLNRAREDASLAATSNLAKRWINIALHDMHIGFSDRFPWAERRAVLVTQNPYDEGTVAINRGSTALVGTSTFWDSTNEDGVAFMRAGGKIVIGGSDEVYEIASVTDGNNAVLSSNFIGGTNTGSITGFASGSNTTVTSAAHGLSDGMKVTITGTTSYNTQSAVSSATTDTFDITATFVADDATGSWSSGSVSGESYEYFEDEYALAGDFGRPVDAQTFSDNDDLPIIGRTKFRRDYPRNKTTGKPRVCTILDLPPSASATPVRKIRLAPPPDEAYAFPYSYITTNLVVSTSGTAKAQFVLDDDEPLVPLRYRHAIVFHALYMWYRDHKDDQRSQEAKAEYTDIMLRVAGDSEIGASRPKLEPRVASYYLRARRPWRSGGGRYDTGNRFDQLRDRY